MDEGPAPGTLKTVSDDSTAASLPSRPLRSWFLWRPMARWVLRATLVIVGVFGGFLAFGFLGLFVGPAVLAVAFTLVQAWRAEGPPPEA